MTRLAALVGTYGKFRVPTEEEKDKHQYNYTLYGIYIFDKWEKPWLANYAAMFCLAMEANEIGH